MNTKRLCILILFLIILYFIYNYRNIDKTQIKSHLIINFHTKDKYNVYV